MSDPTPPPEHPPVSPEEANDLFTGRQQDYIHQEAKSISAAAVAVIAVTVAALVSGLVLVNNTLNDHGSRIVALESRTATPAPSPTVTPTPPTPTPIPLPGPDPSGPGGGVFSIRCLLDHQAPDDPIVYPGQPGAAHNHGFFGAKGVTAFTTIDTLGTAGTSCTLPGDTASYWAPSLIGPDGNLVQPAFMLAYYNANPGVPVRALPHGLKIVAGGTDPDLFGFSCSDQKPYAPIPMSCPSKNVLHVVFPSCWDGVHLDSPDHRSHMAYPVQGGRECPEGFPVRVAKLSIHVQYPGLKNPAGYRFAPNPDGSVPGPHADFFNGWNMAELERLIVLCSNADHENEGPCKQPTA